jgi:hypothetical protein
MPSLPQLQGEKLNKINDSNMKRFRMISVAILFGEFALLIGLFALLDYLKGDPFEWVRAVILSGGISLGGWWGFLLRNRGLKKIFAYLETPDATEPPDSLFHLETRFATDLNFNEVKDKIAKVYSVWYSDEQTNVLKFSIRYNYFHGFLAAAWLKLDEAGQLVELQCFPMSKGIFRSDVKKLETSVLYVLQAEG